MNRQLLLVLASAVCVLGMFAILVSHKPASPATTDNSRIVRDLKGVEAQFVNKETTIASSTLDAIKKDIVNALVARDPVNAEYIKGNGIDLFAVGEKYVIFRVLRPTDNPAPLNVFDVSLLTATEYISGELLFQTSAEAVFVTGQDIYTYKPNEAKAVLVPGSHLDGEETYDHCGGCMGGAEDLQSTHTDHSMALSTYEWVSGKPVKLRDLTFQLR